MSKQKQQEEQQQMLMLFAWPKKYLWRLGSFRKTTELDTYDRALEVFMN
jgi:hypothetical protein